MKAKKIFSFMFFLFVMANFAQGICYSNLKTGENEFSLIGSESDSWLKAFDDNQVEVYYSIKDAEIELKILNNGSETINGKVIVSSLKEQQLRGQFAPIIFSEVIGEISLTSFNSGDVIFQKIITTGVTKIGISINKEH